MKILSPWRHSSFFKNGKIIDNSWVRINLTPIANHSIEAQLIPTLIPNYYRIYLRDFKLNSLDIPKYLLDSIQNTKIYADQILITNSYTLCQSEEEFEKFKLLI